MSEEIKNVNEEEKIEKTNHKGLRRTIIAISLAAIISVCGGVVKTLPHDIDEDFNDLVNKNSKELLVDEIYDLDETVEVKNIQKEKVEEIQLEDAIDLLEDSYKVDQIISSLNINRDELNDIDELHKAAALKLYKDNGIDTIIELYNDSDNSKIDKARIAQQLVYIQDCNDEWLLSNGVALSQSILKRVISAGAIDAYGTFKPEEYNVCDLINTDCGIYREIKLVDGVSGATDSIKVLPVIADEYYKAIEKYDQLLIDEDNEKKYTIDETKEIVKDSLNLSKRCVNKKLINKGPYTYTKKI